MEILAVFLAIWMVIALVFMFIWRNEAQKMRVRHNALQAKHNIAIEGLKRIALERTVNPVLVADKTLKDIGLQAFHADPNCPPDRIYFVPPGMVKPTDYF